MNRNEPAAKRGVPNLSVEAPNAFVGNTHPPSRTELEHALGPAAASWNEMVHELEQDGITAEEWKGVYPNKYGWTLRLKQKSRTIVYLSPCAGCFRVGFILSDRAMEAAGKAVLPGPVKERLAHAPKYPEGHGLRLTVNSNKDLPPIRSIARIKMAN